MSEENDKIKNDPEHQPKLPKLGDDFEKWLQGSKERKEFLEKKEHLNTLSELSDLRESLWKKSLEKKSWSSFEVPKDSFSWREKAVAFTDAIETRQIGDEKKNILQGITQSINVPLRALKDGIVDAGKIIFSPIKETQRTIAYLEEESAAKII